MPMPGEQRPAFHNAGSRSTSWDLLAGIRKFEHSYEEFDMRNASEAHLAFAQGDMPTNKVRRFFLCFSSRPCTHEPVVVNCALRQTYNFCLNVLHLALSYYSGALHSRGEGIDHILRCRCTHSFQLI